MYIYVGLPINQHCFGRNLHWNPQEVASTAGNARAAASEVAVAASGPRRGRSSGGRGSVAAMCNDCNIWV